MAVGVAVGVAVAVGVGVGVAEGVTEGVGRGVGTGEKVAPDCERRSLTFWENGRQPEKRSATRSRTPKSAETRSGPSDFSKDETPRFPILIRLDNMTILVKYVSTATV